PFLQSLLHVSVPGVEGLVAGGQIAGAAALWDGSAWQWMPDLRLTGCADCCPSVAALAVFDDGAGPALYATGLFNSPASGVARWGGAGWSGLGGGLSGFLWGVGLAMLAHDDGSGSALYVGGRFDSAGGVPAANIARWDGERWETVGAGRPGMIVQALAEFEGKLV